MPRADARGRRACSLRSAPLRATALLAVLALVLGACTSDPEPADDVTDGVEHEAAPTSDAEPNPGPEPSPEPTADEPADPTPGPEHPSSPAPAAPATSVPPDRDELTAWLDEVLAAAGRAAPELELGVLVVDEAGREVASLEPDRPLLPASTLKQVTAAAALTTLGPDARMTTIVEATAGVDGAGVLDGDLIVVGGGDPTLVTEEYARFVYPARPRASLDALADQLVEVGLTEVTGQVRGTAPGFTPPALPSGWPERYLDSLDGRYAAGLTVDGGLVTRILLPELDEEEDEEEVDDGGGGEDADADGGDGAPPSGTDPATDVVAEPGPAEFPVNILDQLAALDTDQPPTVRTSLAPDPVLHVAAELTRLLEERGVAVGGEPTTRPAVVPVAARLAAVSSPPLSDVLRFTVQRSDNHLADALALLVARTRTRDGSWSTVSRALDQVLTRFGVPTEGTAFADGSGLSRDDRLTPRALTELDRVLTGSPRFGGSWRSLQAVAGESGTLRARFRGTPAAGVLLGKTGTLRDVSALTGQVVGPGTALDRAAPPTERRHHLTVIGNEVAGVGHGVVRAVVDEVVLALTADLHGCDLAREGDDGPLGLPPVQVRCPG